MRILASLVMAAALTAGCASMRGIKVESDDASSYSVDVTNRRTGTVTVSYTAGEATRELGTVAAGRTERFIVISATPTVTFHARTTSGTTLQAYTVSLSSSGPTAVTIR